MEDKMNMLKGYKTYACMAVLIIAAGLKSFAIIDETTYNTILSVFGPLGLSALRAGIKKEEVK
jgi:hypothetical protein